MNRKQVKSDGRKLQKKTQKNVENVINDIYSKEPQKNYVSNKTDVCHFDDIFDLDNLDLRDYEPKNNRGYRYVLVIIDNFSKNGLTTPQE